MVLLSLDGAAADELQRHAPTTLMRLAAAGTRVTRVIPINPTMTGPAHISMLTGAEPNVHGVVANRFHLPGTPRDRIQRALDTEIEVETLVEAARRHGKKVGSIAFPTLDAKTAERTADFGLAYSMAVVDARIVELTRTDFRSEWVPPGWTPPARRRTSFSPVMRTRFDWRVAQLGRQDVDLVAYDTTDDRVRNYDLLVIEIDDREVPLDAARWFPVSKRIGDALYGSWSKVLRADPSLERVTIYWGAIARNHGYPDDFRRAIDDEIGFWPSAPDEETAIDARTFREQFERFSDFFTRATALAIRQSNANLLLAYQPIIDEAEHQYRHDDEVRRASWAAADRAVAAIAALLDPARDAIVITGDHGVGAVDTEVRINRILASWGIDARWTAFASGNVAHFYRFGGIDDTDVLVSRLRELAAPDGAKVFERVERRSAAMHRNHGDVIAIAHPRFAMHAPLDRPEAFARPTYSGQHGALNTYPQYHTIFIAWGAGVPARTIAQIRATEVARYVSRLLGITPPARAE